MSNEILEKIKDYKPKTIEQFHRLALQTMNPDLKGKVFAVPDFHWEMYDNFNKDIRYQLTVAPVGFSKSTILKIFGVKEFLEKKEIFILYVSSSDSKAVGQFGAIRAIITDKLYQDLYEYTILKDNDHEIEIEFSDGRKQKFQALGAGTGILGINYNGVRPGLILVDDIEEEEQAKNAERTDALADWLLVSLFSRLPSLAKGRVRMIGTVLTSDCVSNRIINNKMNKNGEKVFDDWNVCFYQALREGKSIWEEIHPTKALLAEQAKAPRSFAANYMNAPLDTAGGDVTMEMLQFYDRLTSLPKMKEVHVHFDLASSLKEKADFFAGLVLGRDNEGKIYVLDIVHEKVDAKKQAEIILKTWDTWSMHGLRKVTIDGVAYQATLKTWVDEICRKQGRYITVTPVSYPKDKYTHFLTHVPLFTSRSVHLPRNHPKVQIFINELLTFPDGKHDDTVDSFSGGADNFNKKGHLAEWFK